jgi:hypothetical protein
MLHQHNTALWLDVAQERRNQLAQEAAKHHALSTLKRQAQGTLRRFSRLPWRKQNPVANSISPLEQVTISMAH